MASPSGRQHREAELLKDIVYAANDGVITTFAIIAGVGGGKLAALTVLVLGLASLFADGFSMAISDYLGTESEKEFLEAKKVDGAKYERPFVNGIVTFFSFVIAGFLPLAPFLFRQGASENFLYSTVISFASLFVIGGLRSIFTRKRWFLSGAKMLLLGGAAAGIAYTVGFLIRGFLS